jgi:hypothetical protein
MAEFQEGFPLPYSQELKILSKFKEWYTRYEFFYDLVVKSFAYVNQA